MGQVLIKTSKYALSLPNCGYITKLCHHDVMVDGPSIHSQSKARLIHFKTKYDDSFCVND